MEAELQQFIQSLSLNDDQKERLLKEFKADEKKIVALEFKFKRTLIDKTAITNILNASIVEIEKQKTIIEHAKDELNRTLVAIDGQKKLIEEKNAELNQLLTNLQKTQSQLIQSEKMASLGELTAGIAHEIQNPLNFVNNFSDISKELTDEMNEELLCGNYDDAKLLIDNIKQNLEKITHHGKRAEDIVKGMLQHSRSSSATKEPTDINALADEYIRLCYHGLRAKDKSFNATIKTNFDASLTKVNAIPQDIGRVILNLLTNAFYAVNERKKEHPEGFEPVVSVSTTNMGAKVEIKITDNGNGIPQNIVDKIFQPFFTTKPTGQGTGLGLSLSYDIIKAHNGELTVESKEGKGTTFIIQLQADKSITKASL